MKWDVKNGKKNQQTKNPPKNRPVETDAYVNLDGVKKSKTIKEINCIFIISFPRIV